MTEICHPEWITVTADGSAHKGYDQDWYPRKQQQISGCGPTVGSMMAAYTQRKLEKREITTKDGAWSRCLKYGRMQHLIFTACTRQDGLWKD